MTAGSGRQPRPEGGPDALGAGPLRFASPDDPGYRRRRAGRGLRFEDADGRPVTDDAELARFRRLVIPPAWTEVWICADPNGHLQAVGRDARGRRQYRYHPRFRARRDADKFKRLIEFGAALPRIRRRVRADLATRGLSREKVIAAVVALLDSTHLRVGNDEYARLNRSFGLSTLRSRHASVDGGTIEFRFRGKGGRIEERKLVDRSLAAVVRRCQELPGQALFQYPDGDDATEIRRVSSEDVNAYIRAAAGTDDFSAKDFRTWAATLLAFRAMDAAKAAVTITAEALGDTPTVVRNSYIHPAVLDEIDGAAAAPSASGAAKADRAPADAADPADPKRALATPTRRDELALLAFLRRKRRRTSAGAGASKATSRVQRGRKPGRAPVPSDRGVERLRLTTRDVRRGEGARAMCMNCGCGQPNEDHGKPENITLQDLQRAGHANNQSLRESAQHIVETAQLVTDEPSAREGLAQPAANSGAANAASQGGRGTPASES